MIFNTLIKGGGITGKPIEVTELSTPTEKDVGKIYLHKQETTEYVSPQVGQPFGSKLYFDTSINPLDYVQNFEGDTDLLRTETTDDYYSLGFVDILALQGITGYGHAYIIGVANGDMSVILGLSYIYCDVLTVDQFNAMIGSQFGVSIPYFGWLASEIDTSAVADRVVSINVLSAYDNIAYTETSTKITGDYYKVSKVEGVPIEVGKPVPNIIYYDTSITPDFSSVPVDGDGATYFVAQDKRFGAEAHSLSDVATGNRGTFEMLAFMFNGNIPIPLYLGGTANIEVINAMFSDFGMSFTQKGWQGDGTLNITEKGLELATNLGISQEEFEQALALAFADPVTFFDDPQGIFITKDQYVLEPLGSSGFPIEVTELPTPTKSDVGKIYLLKNDMKEYIAPSVGDPIGDKIYFDTDINPLEYVEVGATYRILGVGDLSTTTYYQLVLFDLFELQGVTGMGHCYVIGMGTPDMSSILGAPYIYCDVLTVDQFNTNVGAGFGISVTEFGWQYNEIDTSSITDWTVSENNVVLFNNIAYTGIETLHSGHYTAKNSITAGVELGKPIPNIIEINPSKTPVFSDNSSILIGLENASLEIMRSDTFNMDSGKTVSIIALTTDIGDKYLISLLYVGGTASVDEVNSLIGIFGTANPITRMGWQATDNRINITEKITEAALKADVSQTDIDVALQVIFSDIVTTFDNAQGLFVEGGENLLFELMTGEQGRPIEVTELPILTENDIGKIFLYTPLDEYYEAKSTLELVLANSATFDALNAEVESLMAIKNDLEHNITGYEFPDSATLIPIQFVKRYPKLKEITFSENCQITFVSIRAFANSSSLTSVILPDSITTIESEAFEGCTALKSITIPPNVSRLEEMVFNGCTSLESVIISEGVTDLGVMSTFSGCTSLKSIVIPNGIYDIPLGAFSGCTSLTNVSISASVNDIYNNAFEGCSSLISFDVDKNNSHYTDIDGNLYAKDGEEIYYLLYYCSGKSETTFTVPDGVKGINGYAFYGNTTIRNIVVPASLTFIENVAFDGCTSLTSFTCRAITPPNLGTTAFDNTHSSLAIYVPAESVDAYKTAKGWSTYADRIQAIQEQ